ncbi:Cytochrome p450 [Neofusicoccum parvum]|uniref:Cytochrome p450 n=1 Tax=Neofusicoccum parvum TaxID=310453 RepID=A0ACB5RTH6_9PEZI|nr:Cytochrome p450 [Neofusicoccum parvum]
MTTRPSMQKFGPLKGMLKPFAGTRNLVIMEGEEWKRWRGIFNSGFSAANLAKHVPAIVNETEKLNDFLSTKAASGEIFEMEPKAVDLTVEIIGHVILGSAFTVQSEGKSYKEGLRDQIYWSSLGSSPGFGALRQLDPYRWARMEWNEAKMNRAIRHIINQRWAQRQQGSTTNGGKAYYAIDLALDAYAADKKAQGQVAATIDEDYMTILQDQMKIFVFAGHDTSSGTICYVLWNLHKHPDWLARVRAEHDRVLGPDPSAAAAAISARPNIVSELPITNAVVKETLRVFPPASTIRGSEEAYPIVDPDTGETFETKGYMVWAPSFGIMRDERYFPDPHEFRPDRFLRDRPGDLEAERQHPHAWRPFEVGPRNCIGQELAMLEVKIAMALMLRRFDFVPSYGGSVDKKFDFVGGLAYPVLFGTAKPNQGMPIRVVERKT